MNYNNETKKSIIKLYHSLKKNDIKGKKRIDIIESTYYIHITTLYNWMNDSNINNIDINKNITYNIDETIEQFIIDSYHKFSSINKFKKYINSCLNTSISYKKCAYYLKKNNLNCFNKKINLSVEQFIIENITINKMLTSSDIILLVKNKFNITISDTSIYNIYKKNNLTYKKIKINNNPYSIEEQKEHLINVSETIKNIDINNLISIDEMSIVLNSHPLNGWEIKGKDCEVKSDNSKIISERYSLIMATSNNKIIDFNIVKKGFKADSYLKFINKLSLKNHSNDFSYLLDNARIHTSKKSKTIL